MSDGTNVEFLERVRKMREEQELAAAKANGAAAAKHDDDLIPDLAPAERSETDVEIDRILGGIGVIDAYTRWAGKGIVKISGRQRESIKVRCPKPEHPDAEPSAWINLDKNVWFCGGCEEGGDAFDIAAYHFGFPVPGYKTGEAFVKLREKMAEDLGYVIKRTTGGEKYVEPIKDVDYDPNVSAEASPAPGGPVAPSPIPVRPKSDPEPEREPAPVISIRDVDDEWDESSFTLPSLGWASLFAENTFLYRWCAENTNHNDVPDEFFALGTGPMALSLMAGRRAWLQSGDSKIFSNHFVCMMGHTGTGKSRAIGQLKALLRAAAPWDKDDEFDKGVLLVPSSSPEALQDAFLKTYVDPSTEKEVQVPVRGLVSWNEMSEIIAIARREGNVLVPKLLDVYDAAPLSNSTRTHGVRTVEEPFGTLVTSTQPRAIRHLFREEDLISGFLNRWWFVTGPDKDPIAFNHSTRIDGATTSLVEVNDWIEGDLQSAVQGAVRLNKAAATAFATWYKHELYPMKVDPLYGRVDHHARKIMFLLTVNNHELEVTADTVERTKLIVYYIIDCLRLMRGQIGQGPERDCLDRVVLIINKYKEANGDNLPTRRYIWRMCGTRFQPTMFDKVVAMSVRIGVLEEHNIRATNGRVTTVYDAPSG